MSFAKHLPGRARHFLTPPRLILTGITLALLVGLSAPGCTGSKENANNPSNPRTGAPGENTNPPPSSALTPLPASAMSTELTDLNGKKFKLSDYAGKVMLINLWATWCGPCRIETPELIKLSQEYKDRGVEVIGLDISPERDTIEGVRAFVKEYNVPYRISMVDRDMAIALMKGTSMSIPQSLLVTRDGLILKRYTGFNPMATPPKLRSGIEEALNRQ
jgi:thiol-disulfide isomerase/thioredoxin